MSTLNYQHPGDAGRDKLKQFRLKLFGPSRTDVWNALAGEIGATVEQRGFWKGACVVADVPPWRVVLDTHTVSNGETSTTYTRVRAPFVNADGFRFTIHRKSIFTALGKLLGMQDVEVGYPAFDEKFVIRGNDQGKLRRLFANARLRELLQSQPSVHLTVKDDEGYFGAVFPQQTDELCFTALGVIKDVDRLKRLYDLFAETLHTLCHIGSAYEDDPGVTV